MRFKGLAPARMAVSWREGMEAAPEKLIPENPAMSLHERISIDITGFLLLIGACILPLLGHAKETDNFSDRAILAEKLADGTEALDLHMNERLTRIAEGLNRLGPDVPENKLLRLLAAQLLHPRLPEMLCQVENWIVRESPIPRYELEGRGVYGGTIGYDDVFMLWYVGLAPSIRLNGVLIGLDKIGHFLGQGWQYYLEDRRLRREKPTLSESDRHEALKVFGSDLEKRKFGYTNDGVYSVGDLAANWQGFLFFNEILGGSRPHLKRDPATGKFSLVRRFTFRDHVTDDWDEALTPSLARSKALWWKIRRNMLLGTDRGGTGVCDALHAVGEKKFFGTRVKGHAPEVYLPKNELDLRKHPLAIDAVAMCASAKTDPDAIAGPGPRELLLIPFEDSL